MAQAIFLSIGRTFNPQQEAFVVAVESYLRGQGLEPRTIGRNYFRNDQPLKVVVECMKDCAGAIVIAFERIHVEKGEEKRGSPGHTDISGLNLPTVWNQIEAALAYATHRPLLVLVEDGLKLEGLLQTGYDWWVQSVTMDQSALLSSEFTQVFGDWRTRCEKSGSPDSGDSVQSSQPVRALNEHPVSAADQSLKELLGSLKVGQLWGMLVALFGLISAIAVTAFKLGHR